MKSPSNPLASTAVGEVAEGRGPVVDATTEAPVEPTPEPTPSGSPLGLVLLIGGLVALWMWKGLGPVVVVLSLILMIFLHELGHFVMARRADMKVTEFFIGFGPRIWSFRRGEVEYGVKAIPAGAYVRIIGMMDADVVDAVDEPRTYRRKSFLQRIGVAVAGSTMHFMLALLLAFVVFVVIGQPSATSWTAGSISEGSSAAVAGLREGDRVVSVAGVPVTTFAEMGVEVRQHPAETVDIGIERGGQQQMVPAELGSRASLIGTRGEDLVLGSLRGDIRLNSIRPTSFVAEAGLVDGDQVVAINGVTLTSLEQLSVIAADASNGELTMTVRRSGGESDHLVDMGTAIDVTPQQGFFGLGPQPGFDDVGVVGAAGQSAKMFGSSTWLAIRSIGVIFNPVNIANFAGQVFSGGRADENTTDVPATARDAQNQYVSENSARPSSILGIVSIGSDFTSSWPTFLLFMAQINIMIGVLNLIPLLPFDGGHVAVACYEKVRELFKRDGQRHLVDANRLMPVVYGVILVMATVGLLAVIADITQPLKL